LNSTILKLTEVHAEYIYQHSRHK